MSVTGKDIAKRLGLSPSTVSQALSNKGSLKPATVALVRRTARELGYVPAAGGASRRSAARSVVHVVLSGTGAGGRRSGLSGLDNRVLSSIEDALQGTGMQSVIVTEQQLNILLDGDSSGALIVGGFVGRETLAFLDENAIPAVVIASPTPSRGVSSVQVDVVGGVRAAMRHLHGLGHVRIGLMNGPDDTLASDLKLTGYLRGLFDAGIGTDRSLICSTERSVQRSREVIDPLLDGPWRDVTAVLCAYEEIAVAALQWARERAVRVPQDLSVVSYHDEGLAELAVPPITTVALAPERLGRLAVAQLFALSRNADLAGSQLLIPSELKLRSSTGPAREA